jgi:hypothetical protein
MFQHLLNVEVFLFAIGIIANLPESIVVVVLVNTGDAATAHGIPLWEVLGAAPLFSQVRCVGLWGDVRP